MMRFLRSVRPRPLERGRLNMANARIGFKLEGFDGAGGGRMSEEGPGLDAEGDDCDR